MQTNPPEQWAEDVRYLAKLADWAAGQGFCKIEALADPDEWCIDAYDRAYPGKNGEGYSADTLADGLVASIQAAFSEREENAGLERRNIISHATMGNTTGEGMSVNDICVEISRQRNKLYQAGKDASAEREARLVGALELVGKILPSAAGLDDAPDSKVIACYMNMGEMRAIKSTLAALKDRTRG